jgi:radical SAM superfamily enzyme YgiQ (UPF0313 family)
MARDALLLVSPPVVHGQRWWGNRIANKPHLASLAGYVREFAEPRTLELDLDSTAPLDGLLEALNFALVDDVGLVGISCWTSMHYLGALAVAGRVRALRPDLPIVVGGHHATAAPDDFDERVCDVVVTGDGEQALRRLCRERPQRGGRREVIAGGTFDQSNPSHIDWEHYGRSGIKARALWIGASRGCAFKCSYCIEPERGAHYSRYDSGVLLDIIERLVALHGPQVIAFSDPLFGSNRRWLEDFLDGLERRALPLMFWCETRADLMTRDLLERFKRCRFMVDFGLDTGSAAMVQRMQKAASPDAYLERSRATLHAANAIGLHHGVYLIFNYPGETPETARETQAFIEQVGAGGGPMSGWLACQTFFILPGTRSYAWMESDAALFGTEIRHKAWWKEAGDHYQLATDVLPSAAWRDREGELTAFRVWNESVNRNWASRYPAEVRQFRTSFWLDGGASAESNT